MVLVTVLWSISLLSALAMAASVTFRGYAGVMAVERDRVQGEALLTAGLETAAGIINTTSDSPLAELETTITLGTGAVRARLNDEGGRIDIGKAPVELLASMLRSIGAPEAAIVLEPGIDRLQWLGIEIVEAIASFAAFFHQVGAAKQAQVLRDGWP